MKSMWAAVYRGQDELSVESVPIPEIGPGEMLVRVDVCGVCPTDIKKIHKGLLPPPRIFGHEIAGTVAEIGAQVQGFRAGDRVVVHHHIPCGSCFYCRHQAYAQCAHYKVNGTTAGFEPSGGGFAEYVRVMDWIVARGTIPIPGSVTAEEASFVEPVNTCLKAVQVANTQPGETVLVVGQGPIGLLLAQIARFAGAAVYVSDTLADRREMGLKMGAELALDGRADVVAEMRAITAGRGVDCVFLAAPGRAAFQQAVDATRPAGRVMVFSATSVGETAEVELGLLCTSEKQILTSYSSSVDIQELAAQLVFERKVRVRELITHRFPLRDAKRAIDIVSNPTVGVLKAVLQIGH